jgi:class 3 adenylate cyclase
MRRIATAGGFLVAALTLAAAKAEAQIEIGRWQNPVHAPWIHAQPPLDDGRGWSGSDIGATVRQTRPDEARTQRLRRNGVVVETVAPDSPASRAGLRKGDVIIELDYVPVGDPVRFVQQIQAVAPGRAAIATIVRDGVRDTIALIPEPVSDSASANARRFRTRSAPSRSTAACLVPAPRRW